MNCNSLNGKFLKTERGRQNQSTWTSMLKQTTQQKFHLVSIANFPPLCQL